MAVVKQLPAQVDWEFVAGAPSTIAITTTGATITSPTVSILSGSGDAVAVSPTVTQAGAVTTIALSAAQTLALGEGVSSTSYRWQLSALVDGAGPFGLVARTLTARPVGSASSSSSTALSLAVTVGATALALAVDLGGPQGPTGATGATGPQGPAATIAAGTTTTGAPGSSASVTNSGTSGAAIFDFTIPQGVKGDTGNTGNTGATGPQGPAATIAVGTTTTGAPGSSASVVNSGTSGAAIFDFTVPQGAGVAAGGTTGQVLAKTSGSDYATGWVAPSVTGGAARPLLSSGAYLDGITGLVLGGIANNGAQTPDSVALSPTAAIDIQVKVTVANWTSGTLARLVAKNLGGSNRQWSFSLQANGVLAAQVSSNGTADESAFGGNSATAVSGTNGQPKWVRFTFTGNDGAGNRVGKFYQSDDGTTWSGMNTLSNAGTVSIFDGTAPIEIGGFVALQFTNLAGTIHRVVIRDGYDGAGNTVFDADFGTATADALAFTESSTNAATVSLVTTRYTYGLPGVQWSTSNATQALAANTVYYQSFIVTAPVIVDMTVFRVTTGPASAANVRTGIYVADSNMQPSGAALVDSGNVAVGTSATGNFATSVTPVTLQPGVYVTAINTSVNLTCQVARGGLVGSDIQQGANAIVSLMSAAQTQGAFPNPGTAWNTRTFAAVGPNHMMFTRWRSQ